MSSLGPPSGLGPVLTQKQSFGHSRPHALSNVDYSGDRPKLSLGSKPIQPPFSVSDTSSLQVKRSYSFSEDLVVGRGKRPHWSGIVEALQNGSRRSLRRVAEKQMRRAQKKLNAYQQGLFTVSDSDRQKLDGQHPWI